MRPTGATRGRINCGSTILITINKSTNKTNYKRPQWCGAKSAVGTTKDEVHDRTGWMRIVSAAATPQPSGSG